MRIFQLAKEISLDSKALVDLCAKLGISNKGSPLANLNDDEVERVRRHVANEKAPAAQTGSVVAPERTPAPVAKTPERVAVRDTNPMRQIGGRAKVAVAATSPLAVSARARDSVVGGKSGGSIPAEIADVSSPEVEVPASLEEQSVQAELVDESVSATEQIKEEPRSESQAASPSRKEFGSSDSSGGRIRDLSSRLRPASKTGEAAAEARKKRPSREPVINLNTRIPKSAAPPPQPASKEPEPMRPDVRLTPEMIAGSRKGMSAPLENFVKQETAKANNKAGTGALSEFKANADKAKVRGKRGGPEEVEDKSGRGNSLSDMRRERKSRGKRNFAVDEMDRDDRRHGRGDKKRKKQAASVPRKDKLVLEMPCSVRSFSEAAGVPAARVLRSLMTMGVMLNINAQLDMEQAVSIATDLGVDIEFTELQTREETLLESYAQYEDNEEDLQPRPPVVTFLGHVDHGKTSLLDYLIGTKIVTGEAGGITQHIRAYQVEKDGRMVSFVDTPGHEAFTEMRARGANVTDIAVLVIAADDGIMPQTEEAISHAKAAGVPIVVAANKIDLPGADLNRVMTQMTEYGLTPSAWGGDVEVVGTSAITGEGMGDLLDTLLTVAELNEYRANPKRPASGVCLESEQASDRGVIVKAIVDNGTLRVGDIVVCGSTYGRVKALYDTLIRNKQMSEAGPSTPVHITGLDSPPEAGERFYVMDDIAQAREIAEARENLTRRTTLSGSTTKVSFETFQERLLSGKLAQGEDVVDLNLIIRADARGSLEAIEKELSKLDHPEVSIKVLQKSVGGISVADITLASASDAVVVGFNVIPDEAARQLAEARNVEIRRYDIIYKLAEDIKAIVEGRLRPEERVVELGRALVKQVFTVSRVGTIAGCYVAQGAIERGCRIRVNRDGRTIGDYALDTLRRIKEDVKEVPRGMECGIKLSNFNDVKQDDILEAYKIESVARKLD